MTKDDDDNEATHFKQMTFVAHVMDVPVIRNRSTGAKTYSVIGIKIKLLHEPPRKKNPNKIKYNQEKWIFIGF